VRGWSSPRWFPAADAGRAISGQPRAGLPSVGTLRSMAKGRYRVALALWGIRVMGMSCWRPASACP
jgi:hypothetical protein